MLIDLHVHTTASDGIYSPAEIVKLAKKAGISVIGIADHDTVDGIEEGLQTAETEGLRLIPAVEINSYSEDNEYHILGYFIDHTHKELVRKLADLKKARTKRMYAILAKLKSLGMTIEADEVFEISGGGCIGRPHIARLLVRKGYVNSFRSAFDYYIGNGKPAYEPRSKLTPEEAIKIIRDAKGAPVLAHPPSLNGDKLMSQLVAWGIVGIEVFSKDSNQEQIKRYLELVHKHGLVATGGSDFHGSTAFGDNKIGDPYMPPEEFIRLEELVKG